MKEEERKGLGLPVETKEGGVAREREREREDGGEEAGILWKKDLNGYGITGRILVRVQNPLSPIKSNWLS